MAEKEKRAPELEKNFEHLLYILKRSRKAFFPEYSCGFFLLILLGINYFTGYFSNQLLIYFLLGLAVFSLISAEYSRMVLKYTFMPEKMVISEGLIKQRKQNVYYHPLGYVPDINVKQNYLQRMLNYGTISVSTGSNSFQIKDIDHPDQVVGLLEDLIENTKNPPQRDQKT
ncbi:MAG TPA: PH domain-containing protein [Candidatus Nanoarchaeia archaeon]|nr:PH domain-containing protein [Candidatus Nanoarchaeia archaeon]